MTHTKRVLIFIGSIVLIIIGLLMLQVWSSRTGNYFPKWPAILAVFGLYYYLFPKKKEKQE